MSSPVKVNPSIEDELKRKQEAERLAEVTEDGLQLTKPGGSSAVANTNPYTIGNNGGYTPTPFTPDVRTTPQQTQTSTPAAPAAPSAPVTPSLDDVTSQLLRAQMEAQKKESAELRRHGRTQQMIGGITDAANALASMYNTTRGAAPTYDPRQSLDGKALARYDRAKAEMDKEHAKQMAYIQQLRKGEMDSLRLKNAARRLDLNEADQLRKMGNTEFAKYKFELQNNLNNRKLDIMEKNYEATALYRQGLISLRQYQQLLDLKNMENKASGAYEHGYSETEMIDPNTGNVIKVREPIKQPSDTSGNGGKEPYPLGGGKKNNQNKEQYPIR